MALEIQVMLEHSSGWSGKCKSAAMAESALEPSRRAMRSDYNQHICKRYEWKLDPTGTTRSRPEL